MSPEIRFGFKLILAKTVVFRSITDPERAEIRNRIDPAWLANLAVLYVQFGSRHVLTSNVKTFPLWKLGLVDT